MLGALSASSAPTREPRGRDTPKHRDPDGPSLESPIARSTQQSLALAPLVPRSGPLRNLVALRRAPMRFFTRAAAAGDVVRFRAGHLRCALVSHPELVREILRKDEHSRERNLEVPLIRRILGDGALTSDGPAWTLARRASAPPLAPRAVEKLNETLARVSEERLDALAALGEPARMFPEMAALTLRVTIEALLGQPISDHDARLLADDVLFAQAYLFFWLGLPLDAVPRIPTANNRRFYRVIDGFHALTEQTLRAEATTPFTRHLAELRDADGQALSEQSRRDQLMTMLVAAPENTATTLAWTMHLLATHPEHQRRLREEGPSSAAWGPTLREALRLYPGAPYLDRRVEQPTEVGGHALEPGTILVVAPYLIHRDPRFWSDPSAFQPERFAHGEEPLAWMPFGVGPRRCLGEHFAMAVLRAVLPRVIERFELEPLPGYVPSIDPVINLRPGGGLPLLLRERRPPNA